MTKITRFLLPADEKGNDPSAHRYDEDYLARVKPIPTGLNRFSLNGSSEMMRERMLDDKYILGRLAILGQMTVFYAKPNSGKTLLTIHLLIKAITEGGLDPRSIFYINADDTHKGLTEKLEIAEKYGFQMLSPGYAGHEGGEIFKREMLIDAMTEMVRTDTASGRVVILDTLKKFTNLMNKDDSSKFAEVARHFVSKGGSIIMLAHTNKNRDNDGKLVYAGTSDISDDSDCCYMIDVIEESEITRTVMFENFKDRGIVEKRASYRYSCKPANYLELLDSVSEIDKDAASRIAEKNRIIDEINQQKPIIDEIKAQIRQGTTQKTELVKAVAGNTGESRKRIHDVLRSRTGTRLDEGHLWRVTTGYKNAHVYSLISGEIHD